MTTKTLTVRLEEETIRQLKEIAKEDLRTIGKTIELMVKERLMRSETTEEFMRREKPYIDRALAQEGIPTTIEELFHD